MSVDQHHNLIANGIVVKNCYQEQVMQVFNRLGGIALSAAYKLIKAISKKLKEVIEKFQPEFIKGCVAQGIGQAKAKELFELILKFGGYGFNKSHSTRYAIVAFQTAYLKTYYPVEFMAALLTYEIGSTEKVVDYIEECRRMGLKVLPPDVNVSDKDFTPVYVTTGGGKRSAAKKEGVIRFGLCAVRGVGEKAVQEITAVRAKGGPYKGLFDFCERVDLRAVQRGTIEALIKCGAMASLGNRAQLLQVLDRAIEMGQQAQSDQRSGQLNMFAAAQASPARMAEAPLPSVEEFQPAELLKWEKELLGFYITSHPLTEHQNTLERYATASTKEAHSLAEGTEVLIGGMINRVKKVVTKNGRSAGQQMAIITLEDLEGQIDGTLFAETFAEVSSRHPEAVSTEAIVLVRGKVDRKRETPSLLVNEVLPIEQALSKLTQRVGIKLDSARHSPGVVESLKSVLERHAGKTELLIRIQSAGVHQTLPQKVVMRADRRFAVRASRQMIDDLEQVLGGGCVEVFGEGARRMKRLEQKKLFAETAEIPAPTAVDVPADLLEEPAEE